MALGIVFHDSFSHYTTSDFLLKWSAYDFSPFILSTAGPRGAGALAADQSNDRIQKSLPASDKWCVCVRMKRDGASNNQAGYFLYLGDSGSDQCGLYLEVDGKVSFYRGTTSLATSTASIPLDQWTWVAFKVTIHDTTGAYEVRLNNTNVLSASSVDTKNTANTTADTLYVQGRAGGFGGPTVNGGNARVLYADLVVMQGANADFISDAKVNYYPPNGNGNYSQMTGSDGNSVDNYLLVDEATPNADTDYNESSTVGNKDSYAATNISDTPSTIYAVSPIVTMKKDDAGSRSAATLLRSGTTDQDGATHTLGVSYAMYQDIYEVDPNTSAAWTLANANASEPGFKVIA